MLRRRMRPFYSLALLPFVLALGCAVPESRDPMLAARLDKTLTRLDHTGAVVSARVLELPTVNPSVLGPGHIMKRIALYAELPMVDGRTVGVVNVHNEPFARPRDRLLQHQAFLDAVNRRAPEVAVCCGDFNPSLSQRGEPGLELLEAAGFENAFAHRWRTLDTCFARGHARYVSAESLRLGGSDHRPIVVRLRL